MDQCRDRCRSLSASLRVTMPAGYDLPNFDFVVGASLAITPRVQFRPLLPPNTQQITSKRRKCLIWSSLRADDVLGTYPTTPNGSQYLADLLSAMLGGCWVSTQQLFCT
jgi:hypothetical protein